MEHPGGGESEVENTAEVAVDATFDAFEAAQDAGEMTPMDAFNAMFKASTEEAFDSPEDKVEQTKNAIENREATMERLTSHYGGQLFQYGKYHGTISEMLDMCSAVKSTLGDGFDAVVSMIDDYKVDEIILEEKTSDEESNPDENILSLNHDEKKPHDKPKVEVDKKDEKSLIDAKKEEAVVKEEPETAVEVRVEALEKAAPEVVVAPIIMDNKSEKKTREKKKAEEEAEAFVEKEAVDTPSESAEEVVIVAPVAVEVSTTEKPREAKELNEVAQAQPESVVIEVTDTLEEVPALAVTEELAQEATQLSMPESEPEPIELEELSEPKVEHIELPTKEPTDILERAIEVETSSEDMPEEKVELFEVESMSPEESHQEVHGEKIDHHVAEIFDDWSELAEDDAPLETLIITMTEQLEEVAPIEQEVPEEESEKELVLETVTIELSEMELEEDARPELYMLLQRVQSAKASVERIYQAKTKEECIEYIRQLTEDLSAILLALGYDNPEAIIKQFLTTHSPEVLRGLIAELEQALRQAIQREVYQRRMRSTKHRHVRLTKFVSYVMKALLPRRSAPSEA